MVEAAQPPAKPADPDPVRYVLVGLVAGLALALVAVLLLEYFDERVREPEDLARAAGTPLVVMVPRATRRRKPFVHIASTSIRQRSSPSDVRSSSGV